MSREKGQTPVQMTKSNENFSKSKFTISFPSHHHPPVISLSPLVFLSASLLAVAKALSSSLPFVLLFEKLHTQRVSQPVREKLVIHLETVKLFVTLEHLESVEHLETSTSRRAPQDRQPQVPLFQPSLRPLP